MLEKSGDAPEEHAGVPEEAAGFDVASGHGGDRLFSEAFELVDRGAADSILQWAALDVAVAGFRARGRDAHDDEIAGSAGGGEDGAEEFLVGAGVGDVGVSGKDSHEGVAVAASEMKC